jgi:hypothetical protein
MLPALQPGGGQESVSRFLTHKDTHPGSVDTSKGGSYIDRPFMLLMLVASLAVIAARRSQTC